MTLSNEGSLEGRPSRKEAVSKEGASKEAPSNEEASKEATSNEARPPRKVAPNLHRYLMGTLKTGVRQLVAKIGKT